MKALKFLAAGTLALLVANTASAADTVRIVGSTAFRAATNLAIRAIVPDSGRLVAITASSYSESNFTGSSRIAIKGTVGGVANSYVKTNLVGSVGGIQWLDQGIQTTFIPNATVDAISSGTTNFVSLVTSGTDTSAADVAMSDTRQSTTIFNSNVLVENPVGVIPFFWVASVNANNPALGSGTTTSVSMTPQLAKVLLANGRIPLSQLTGNASVTGTAYLVGRDADSGTRVVTFAESGFGSSFLPRQYENASGVVNVYPATTIPSNPSLGTVPLGTSGYASGADIVTAIRTPITGGVANATKDILIGYMGRSDKNNAIKVATGPSDVAGQVLSYSGVEGHTPSLPEATITTGNYSFWSYEYLSYKNTLAGEKLTIATALANEIATNQAGNSGITNAAMGSTKRVTDGAPVTR